MEKENDSGKVISPDVDDGTNDFQSFIHQLNFHPMPTSSETLVKLKAYRKNPTIDLRNEIVEDNLRLVISIAKPYAQQNHINLMDLIQEGSIGLMDSVSDFDTEKGYAFSTFAVPYIKNAIRRFLSDKARLVHVPQNIQVRIRKVRRATADLTVSLGRTPSDDEILAKLNDGTTAADLAELSLYDTQVYSLDQNLSPDSESDDASSLADFVSDDAASPSEASDEKETSKRLQKALNQLSERERDILLKRYGYQGKIWTLKEISDSYGISLERVRQIEAEALTKMKKFLK
jgi:RNA polymerase sigma factor (sigma-70 family)